MTSSTHVQVAEFDCVRIVADQSQRCYVEIVERAKLMVDTHRNKLIFGRYHRFVQIKPLRLGTQKE